MRDSISYAVANRFNTVYPMDMENLKNNFSRINTISLEQIGIVISRVSEDIIDRTIEKSKEMDCARLLTERAAADYNRDIENINEDRGGKNDLYRRDEITVMDGGKCIYQLRGVRPFLSDKFYITKHKNYKLLDDYDNRNLFDVEDYLKTKDNPITRGSTNIIKILE